MPTLLDIGTDLEALATLLDDAATDDGEITPESAVALESWFAELEGDLASKADGYAALIRDRTMRAACRREESERLAKLAQTDENLVKRLKERLKLFLDMTGRKRIDTDRYRITVAANGGKLPVEIQWPADHLPDGYYKVEYRPDTEAIRAELEKGNWLAFAKLGVRGSHLRIS